MEIRNLRKDYERGTLDKKDLSGSPFQQLQNCLMLAIEQSVPEPNAMCLATCSKAGIPSNRMVLLRELDEHGLVFFTSYESRKAHDLLENGVASAVFWWAPLEKQVIVYGRVEKISEHQSDVYFASRPRKSQLAAWASHQDEPIDERHQLEASYQKYQEEFEGRDVPRPEYWGGFRLIPERFEFWQGRRSRLHDRFQYEKYGNQWEISRLSP